MVHTVLGNQTVINNYMVKMVRWEISNAIVVCMATNPQTKWHLDWSSQWATIHTMQPMIRHAWHPITTDINSINSTIWTCKVTSMFTFFQMFPNMRTQPLEQWTHTKASLEKAELSHRNRYDTLYVLEMSLCAQIRSHKNYPAPALTQYCRENQSYLNTQYCVCVSYCHNQMIFLISSFFPCT